MCGVGAASAEGAGGSNTLVSGVMSLVDDVQRFGDPKVEEIRGEFGEGCV